MTFIEIVSKNFIEYLKIRLLFLVIFASIISEAHFHSCLKKFTDFEASFLILIFFINKEVINYKI